MRYESLTKTDVEFHKCFELPLNFRFLICILHPYCIVMFHASKMPAVFVFSDAFCLQCVGIIEVACCLYLENILYLQIIMIKF